MLFILFSPSPKKTAIKQRAIVIVVFILTLFFFNGWLFERNCEWMSRIEFYLYKSKIPWEYVFIHA